MSKTISLESLVSLVGGRLLRGDLAAEYSGLASLEKAGSGEISFLGNIEKYALDFQKSEAGVILIEPGTVRETKAAALIEVAKPSDAFGKAIAFFAREARKFEAGIHPRAWVAPTAKLNPEKVSVRAGAVVMDGAEVGDGTEIGANAVISEGVKMGKDCLIYSNVTVREHCVLGDRVILQPGAVIGADGYGYQFVGGRHEKIPQVGNVVLEDDVEVGANTTIDRARFGTTRIGEGTKIDNLVQIGHNAEIGKHCLIIAQTGMAGSSKFEDYVTCAAQCGVVGHITVGKGAILGSRSGVTTNLEGGKTYLGNPAIPFVMEQKYRALVRKLPKLLDDVKELRKRSEN